MDNNAPKYKLTGNSTVTHVSRDSNDVLVSFDIVNPLSKVESQGSTLHFDLSGYSHQGENIAANKVLREKVYKAVQLLTENVPAFTALATSVAESGARKFLLQNPEATRFGMAVFPGITTIESIDANKAVIMVGNLDQSTAFSQIGYERFPKHYIDAQGAKQDLRSAVVLMDQLAMASKDIQQWPLPLSLNGQNFGREETIHNVVKAGIFVRNAIHFDSDDTPSLDDLRHGRIPDKLREKGYPCPTIVPIIDSKKENTKPHAGLMMATEEAAAFAVIRDRVAHHLGKQMEFSSKFDVDKSINTDLSS